MAVAIVGYSQVTIGVTTDGREAEILAQRPVHGQHIVIGIVFELVCIVGSRLIVFRGTELLAVVTEDIGVVTYRINRAEFPGNE